MAENIGNLSVSVGADIASFEAGMAQVQADLGKVANAANAAAGRYSDSQGRMREANGRFVSSATLAAEAAARLGGSLGTVSDAANKAGSSINSGLIANFAAFDAKVKPLNEGIGRLGEGLKGLGGGLTAGVTIPLGLLGGASLKMAGDLEVAKVAFTTMLGSAQAATQTLDELKQFAADTPFEFPEIQDAAKKLLAFNTPAAELKETLRQLGDISAGIGAPIGEIADLFGKARVQGRLFQEDINQLTGRGIPIIQQLAKQFNVTEDGVRKLVESGKVNFGNLQTAFADLTKEGGKFGGLMAAQSETLPGLFSTLSDNAGQALASLGQDIAKSLNLKEVVKGLSDFVKSAADAFRGLSPATKDFAIAAGVVAASLGPIAFGLGSVLTALPELVAGLEVLGLTSAAAFGPIGIGAAAVAAAAYLIITNWGDVVAYFSSPEVADLFGNLADAAESAADAIGEAFSTIAANSQNTLGGMASSQGAISQIVQVLTVDATSAANIFAGTIRGITSLLTGDFSQALAGAQQALFGLIDPLAAVFGFTVRRDDANPFLVLSRSATEFNAVGPQLAANLALLNNAKLDGLAAAAATAAKQIGLLADLEARLKAAKDALPDLTSEKDIAASNILIASLEVQIKRLRELGIGSKEAQKAIAALRLELSRLTALDSFLGDAPSQMQVLERRADALAGGLKKLVSAGVSTSSAAFQGFARDLVNTAQAFDTLAAKGGALKLKPVEVRSLVATTLGDTLQADVARLLGDFALQPLKLKAPIRLEPIIDGFGSLKASIEDGFLDAAKGFDTKGLGEPLLAYSQALNQAGDTAKIFGGDISAAFSGFDIAGQKADAARAYLENLRERGFGPLSPVVQAAAANLRQYTLDSENAKLLTMSLSDGFAALGSSIGGALGEGTNILGAALAGLIDVLADYAGKKGKLLIADGLGELALGNIPKGAALLAAGTGLLVASGVARAGANSLRASGSPGIASAPKTNYNSLGSNGGQTIKVEVVGELKGRGAELVAVLRGVEYRELRTR